MTLLGRLCMPALRRTVATGNTATANNLGVISSSKQLD
jgi:hypothetical protein